jgi:type II secretory pathway pseudopilin PulG
VNRNNSIGLEKESFMNRIKLWPHGIIVVMVVALVAGLGAWFYSTHQQTVEAEALPNAARIQRVDGEVAFSDNGANNDANERWTAATVNQPFSEGDRIYTRDRSRTSLAFSGRNFARLDPNTSLDCVSLGDRRTQLALRDGSAMFDVGYLQPDELFEVATPNGAVDFTQPGLYNVGFDRNGGVLVSVLSGLAQVVGLGGSGQVNKGEMLTLLGQTAAEVALSRLNRQDAGYQVDDYYRYQYPNSYDGRYSNYDAYLSDPYYYDPYQRNVSYKYVSSNIPGANDLDYYGDWQNVDGYGNCWRPRAASGWVPYQQGQWTNNYPFGPTWVSSEPWGYAPYHYGRWANVGNQWYWIPDGVNTTPSYAPALVAFVPLDANQIGWVPLGPGDSYAPRYYDNNWQPRYLTRANVSPAQLINLGIPGAVTVVPVDAWGRPIDPRTIHRIDQQRLASVRSTLDPLTLTPLRNAVIHSAWGRGKIDLPPGIARKLNDTRVLVGSDVRESKFRRDPAKWMRVERVSDTARNQKFKVRDERDAKDARNDRQEARPVDNGRRQEADTGRKQDLGRVTAEATRGNRDAQRQTRQLEQKQRKETRAQEKATRAQAPRRENIQQPAQQKAQQRAQQPIDRPAQPRAPQKAQRQAEQRPQGERVARPAKSEAKQQSQPAPNQERKQKPSAQSGGHDQGGGGKGKGKKP